MVSVAAVDVNNAKADFSQYNKDVEISGPGVGVLSTVPNGKGLLGSLDVGGLVVEAFPMEGSPSCMPAARCSTSASATRSTAAPAARSA